MPIEYPEIFRMVSDDEFADIDRRVMGCAFNSQNELGRLCEEKVYENDVARALRASGSCDVHTQLTVVVSHRNFRKTYRLDLVVDGVLYELKAVERLAPSHDAQAFHYAAPLGLDRIKLIQSDIAFEITSLDDMSAYEKQLTRLLRFLPIRAWQWINIHHSKMNVVTLSK